MADLERQLRRYADQVEGAVGSTPAASRSRRRWFAGAAALLGVVAIGAVLVLSGDAADVETEPSATQPVDTTTPASSVPTTTSTTSTSITAGEPVFATPEAAIGAGPLSARDQALVVRTAGGALVWGGTVGGDAAVDGAVYDLATGEWRTVSPSPLPATVARPLAAPIGDDVWLITRLVSTGPFDGDPSWSAAATYDTTSDEWSAVPDAPLAIVDLVAAPELDVVFAVGRDEVVRFDAGSSTWESTGAFAEWELIHNPVIPVDPAVDPAVVWTGRELVAVAGALDGTFAVQTWTPEGGWVARGTIESGRSQVALDAEVVDGEVWVVGYDMTVHAFDPQSGAVRELPSLPVMFQEGTPEISALADGRVVVARWPGMAVWTGEGWEVEPMRRHQEGTIAAGLDGQPAVWSYPLDDAGATNSLSVVALPRAGTLTEVLIGPIAIALGADESIDALELLPPEGDFADRPIWLRVDHPLTTEPACSFFHGGGEEPATLPVVTIGDHELEYACGWAGVEPFLDRMRNVFDPAAVASIDRPEGPLVVVPSVVGLFFDQAEETLRNQGLVPVVEFRPVPFGDPSVGLVIEQHPAAFVELPAGSEVVVVVGEAADPGE